MDDMKRRFALVMADLNSVWTPYDMQAQIIADLIFHDTNVFAECGRSFGKTALGIYALYVSAILRAGSTNLIFAPLQNQARELYWNDRSTLQEWLPRFGERGNLWDKYIASIDQQQMLIRFKNGSYIKCDGMMEFDSKRGKPFDFAVSDEFKDSPAGFWKAFEPNLTKLRKGAIYKPTFLAMGTIPEEEDHHFFKVKQYFQFPVSDADIEDEMLKEFGEDYEESEIDKYVPKFNVYEAPSSVNPHISKRQLLAARKKAEAMGELDVYYREYECKLTKNPRTSIFPMIDKVKHIVSYDSIVADIKENPDNYYFISMFDPGTSTIFANLICAVHRYTKIVYCLDEQYVSDQRMNFSKKMWNTSIEKCNEIGKFEWFAKGYDYAAKWFANEIANEMNDGVIPCDKDIGKKDARLSFIKMLLLENKLFMTERCKYLFWELDNMKRDEHGSIAKQNDHLVDCLRYCLNMFGYNSLEEELIPNFAFDWYRPKKVSMEADLYGRRNSDSLINFSVLDQYGVL